MRKALVAFVLLLVSVVSAHAQLDDPFAVDIKLEADEILLSVTVPEKHYLYADHFKVFDAVGNEQEAVVLPDPTTITDPNTGKPEPVYAQSFHAVYSWKPKNGGSAAIHVQYWGCNDEICFIPQTKVLELHPSDAQPATVESQPEPIDKQDWQMELDHYEFVASHAGRLNAEEFMEFLEEGEGGKGQVQQNASAFRLFLNDPEAFVRVSGLLPTILFILIGGLALNLTPCVLPMIPINLAIIGAGAQAGSRKRGFALGATYGLGMTLAYGLLGVVLVLLRKPFGSIQSSPWFNLVIALIFVVLALAMFDIINIDFSRFQAKFGGQGSSSGRGSYVVALSMGAVAALLAGACIAPVVLAVLLLASSIGPVGMVLPFVLGFGMALPWPFAGAGLSFLPKPGKWMQLIKFGFAIGIVFFAFYYGHLSYRGFRPAKVENGIDGRTNEGFAALLKKSRMAGKPVLIDFTASWCKNCKEMEKTTFKDEAVIARLEDYTVVRYVSEDIGNPNTMAVWKYFDVQGLPTFVVLDPEG